MVTEYLIPQDITAEQSVLGALLMDNDAKYQVIDLLESGMFFRESHNLIYQAMMDIEYIDHVTVCSELERRGQLKQAGGESYLVGLIAAVPSSIHARYYAQTVERTYMLRKLAELPTIIKSMVYEEAPSVDHVWSKIRSAVDAVQPKNGDDSVLEWEKSLLWYVDVQCYRVQEKEEIESGKKELLDFPWAALSGEGRIRRLRPNTLTIVSAGSGHGKTSFAEQVAEHWARRGFNTLFFHAELSHEIMVDRRTARHTGIPMSELDAGIEPHNLGRYTDVLAHWPGQIIYIHCPGWTASRIAAFCQKYTSKKRVDAVIIDYFQKIAYEPNRFNFNSAQARGQQVEAIKTAIAETLGIPVVILSQYNRSGQIRDTGELEEKCNLWIELDREKLKEDKRDLMTGKIIGYKDKPDPYATVKITKNTMGDTWNSHLFFNGPRFQWNDTMKGEER